MGCKLAWHVLSNLMVAGPARSYVWMGVCVGASSLKFTSPENLSALRLDHESTGIATGKPFSIWPDHYSDRSRLCDRAGRALGWRQRPASSGRKSDTGAAESTAPGACSGAGESAASGASASETCPSARVSCSRTPRSAIDSPRAGSGSPGTSHRKPSHYGQPGSQRARSQPRAE